MNLGKFAVLDIETLGVAKETRTGLVAMPSFSFVIENENGAPVGITGILNVQEQLNLGAEVCASTLGFWMDQSENVQNNIKQALTVNTSAMLEFTGGGEPSNVIAYSTNEKLFLALRNYLPTTVPYFGNGPEFDCVIFEAISKLTCGTSTVPWPFWGMESVRTMKSVYKKCGGYAKSLEEEAIKYAKSVMEEEFKPVFSVPEKHDPLFDALVEYKLVKLIAEKVKI